MFAPADVLRMRNERLAWLGTPLAAMYEERNKADEVNEGMSPRQRLVFYRYIAHAEVFLVAPAMTELAIVAGAALPDTEFRRSDMSADSGLIVWDGPPIATREFKHEDLAPEGGLEGVERSDIFAASWHYQDALAHDAEGAPIPGIVLSWYEDRDRGSVPESFDRAFIRRSNPRLVNLSDDIILFRGGTFERIIAQDPGTKRDRFRVLFATWLLMAQTLSIREPAIIPRAISRQCRRMRTTEEISVVRLRHIHATRDDESSVERDWQCRWLVRGHWRQQWMPSEQRHHPRWIAPYIKGPEDKPLRVRERVTMWSR